MTESNLIYITENISDLKRDDWIIGDYLYDREKQLIARVEGLLVESGTYLPRYLVFTCGGFLRIKGKTVLLPSEFFEVMDLGKIKSLREVEFLQDAPTPEDLEKVTRQEEEEILAYFDLQPYWAVNPPEETQ